MKTCSQILYELNQENIKQWELYHKDIKKNRPKSVGMPVWRTGGFVLFDKIGDLDPRVHLELLTRPINIEEPDQVAFYRRAFAKLLDASLAADGARDLLERVIEDFRGAD